jgi:hypothetical protein
LHDVSCIIVLFSVGFDFQENHIVVYLIVITT